ncbi:hypothetical protein [Achromobacter aloeverae]
MKENPSTSRELESLLTQLANSEPYRSANFIGREQRTMERISNWAMGVACGLVVLMLLLAIYYKFFDSNVSWVKTVLLLIAIGVQLSALFSVIVRAVGMLLLATRWKSVTLTTLLREVEVNEAHARRLSKFSEDALARAEQHLRLKLSKVDRRAAAFLGDKTAVLSLIALTLPIMKAVGGLHGIAQVLSTRVEFTSWESISAYFFVFLLGTSLGAVGLKLLGNRIRYQLDILSLARSKFDQVVGECAP